MKGYSGELHFNLATVYRRKEMVDEAIAEYKQAVYFTPTLADAWYDLGIMYRANHDNDLAVEAFRKYLELTKGKDSTADQRVKDDIKALGGEVDAPSRETPKKKKPR